MIEAVQSSGKRTDCLSESQGSCLGSPSVRETSGAGWPSPSPRLGGGPQMSQCDPLLSLPPPPCCLSRRPSICTLFYHLQAGHPLEHSGVSLGYQIRGSDLESSKRVTDAGTWEWEGHDLFTFTNLSLKD